MTNHIFVPQVRQPRCEAKRLPLPKPTQPAGLRNRIRGQAALSLAPQTFPSCSYASKDLTLFACAAWSVLFVRLLYTILTTLPGRREERNRCVPDRSLLRSCARSPVIVNMQSTHRAFGFTRSVVKFRRFHPKICASAFALSSWPRHPPPPEAADLAVSRVHTLPPSRSDICSLSCAPL